MAERLNPLDSAKMRTLAKNLNNPELLDVDMDKIDPQKKLRIDKALGIIRSKYFVGDGRDPRIPEHIANDELQNLLVILEAVNELAQDFYANPEDYALADTPNADATAMVPSEAAISVVEGAGGEIMNAAGEYRLLVKDELHKRELGKTGAGAPPDEPPKKNVESGNFDEEDFRKRIREVTGNPDFFTELNDLRTLLDKDNPDKLVDTYPRKRAGKDQKDYAYNQEREHLQRMQNDAELIAKLLKQIPLVEKYIGSDSKGAAEHLFIDSQIKKYLLILEARLREKVNALQTELSSSVLDRWERDSKGKKLFDAQEAVIQRVEARTPFASLSEYVTLFDTLSAEYDLAEGRVDTAGEKLAGMKPPAGTLDKEKAALTSRYVDSRTAIFDALQQQMLEFWNTKHLDGIVLRDLRAIEGESLTTTAQYKSNFDRRSQKINDLKSDRQTFLAALPANGEIQRQAGESFDRKVQEAEKKLNEMSASQYSNWEAVEMRPVISSAETVRANGETTAASGTDAEVDAALAALSAEDKKLDTASDTASKDFIDAKKRTDAQAFVKGEKDKNQAVRDKLNQRKRDIATKAAENDVEAEKGTKKRQLVEAITEVEKIDYEGNEAEEKKNSSPADLAKLEELKRQIVEYRTDLINRLGVPINEIDSRYDIQFEKLKGLLQRARIRNMTMDQIVEEIIANDANPFIPNKEIQNQPNATVRLILNTFQNYNVPKYEGEPDREEKIKDERRKRNRAIIKVFEWQYVKDAAGVEEMPAANTEKLYERMDPLEWGLRRETILEITNDPTTAPDGAFTVGHNIQEMLRYGIEVVGKNSKHGGIYQQADDEKKVEYGKVIGKNENEPSPKDKLKAFLHKKFVEEKGALSEEDFNTAWKLFYLFDLFSIGLAQSQRWTKTRSHNTHFKNDTNYASYPLHIAAHKLNRYGSEANSLLHLTLFTGKYPDGWARSGVHKKHAASGHEGATDDTSEESDVEVHGGVIAMQGMVKEFTNTYSTLDGISGAVYSEADLDAFIIQKKEEIARRRTEEKLWAALKVAKDRGDDPSTVHVEPVTADEVEFDREEGRSLMWDQALFPDHFDFLTKKLNDPRNPTEIQSLANYALAKSGWENVLDMTIGELKGVATSGKVTLHDIEDDNGVWVQFIEKGLGLAKLVPGNHRKWFVPLTRYLIARISAEFDPHGEDELSARTKLRDKLKSRVQQAYASGEGGLEGLGFETLFDELDDYDKSLDLLSAAKAEEKWVVLPKLLKPRKTRTNERRSYVDLQFKHDYPQLKNHNVLKQCYDLGTPQAACLALLAKDGYSAVNIDEYYELRDKKRSLHRPANRKKNIDTTQSEKKAA